MQSLLPAGKPLTTLISSLLLSSVLSAPLMAQTPDKTELSGDYHLSLYNDMYGDVMELEAFTKQADKQVFFGIGCSSMSPFPVFQVLLFDDEILSETPKFMDVVYEIDGAKQPNTIQGLQAVLKPTLNADEISNHLRIELGSKGAQGELRVMNQSYGVMMDQFSKGKSLQVTFSHRKLGQKAYEFSLKGLDKVLQDYSKICRK